MIINKLCSKSTTGTDHYTQLVWAETDRLGCGTVYYMVKNQNLIIRSTMNTVAKAILS